MAARSAAVKRAQLPAISFQSFATIAAVLLTTES